MNTIILGVNIFGLTFIFDYNQDNYCLLSKYDY